MFSGALSSGDVDSIIYLWTASEKNMDYCAVEQVSKMCGKHCTADGIHYRNSTYDVVSQMILNKLKI